MPLTAHMPPVPAAHADLGARVPVWEALSELFLDTDTSLSRRRRATQLAASPYSIEQLEYILVEEVYPVCKYNLWAAAGDWEAINPDWLKSKILGRLSSPFRVFNALNIGRLTVHSSPEWQATKHAVIALRAASPSSEA